MAYNTHKTVGQSKKAIVALITLIIGFIVYASSAALIVIFPATASYVVTISNLMFVLIGSVSGSMLIGQSFVEWKSANNVETTNSHSDSYTKEYKKDINETINLTGVVSPKVKYKDDGSVE